jgi:hypothetical protein
MVVPAPEFGLKNDTLTVHRINDYRLFYYTKPLSALQLVIFDKNLHL